MMDNHIYIQGCHDWLIVSPTPIAEGVSEGLQESYKMLLFQVLSSKPIVCVCVSDKSRPGNEPTYPVAYPGTTIVPVSEWSDVSIEGETILINDVFVSMLLGKSAYETSMTDLLDLFEVLTDTEKLVNFEDIHGLIIGGVRCGM
jgi:hypothetical protein